VGTKFWEEGVHMGILEVDGKVIKLILEEWSGRVRTEIN
jgi:hypothetical protein